MQVWRRVFGVAGPIGVAVGVSVVVLMIGLWAAGYPAGRVMAEWVVAAVGDKFNVMVAVKNSCPLLLTGLCAGVAFRAGVINIGGEGQSVIGAIFAVAVATRIWPGAGSGWLAMGAAMMAGVIGGAAYAGVAAGLGIWRKAPVVLTTILLNFVAVGILGMALEGWLKSGGTQAVQSDVLPRSYWLPILGGGPVHVGVMVAVMVAVVLWGVQSGSVVGFEWRVMGLNPEAARYAGMGIGGREVLVLAVSGGCAGLSGAIQTMGVGGHVLTTEITGYGYAGVAVALLGRLHPVGIAAAALFFALLDQGAASLETSAIGLPHETADILKGLITLGVLVGMGRQRE